MYATRSAGYDPRAEDAARTYDDWLRLDVVTLRLKCTNYHLVQTGTRVDLAARLVEYLAGSVDLTNVSAPQEDDHHYGDDEYLSLPEDASDDEMSVDNWADFRRHNTDVNAGDENLDFNDLDPAMSNTTSTIPYDGTQGSTWQEAGITTDPEAPNLNFRNNSMPAAASLDGAEPTVVASTHQNPPSTTVLPPTNMPLPPTTTVTPLPTNPPTVPTGIDVSTAQNARGQTQRTNTPRAPGQQQPNSQLVAELRALRNEVKNLKTQVTTRAEKRKGPAPNGGAQGGARKRQPPSSSQVNPGTGRPPVIPRVSTGRQPCSTTNALPSVTFSTNTGNGSTTPASIPPTLPQAWEGDSPTTPSPFLPPSIKEALLKKIEKREFVYFKDLLPNNQIADELAHGDEPCFNVDRTPGNIKYSDTKLRKEKINSLQRWSEAWITFSQAHLHYHPQDFVALFLYHKQMIQHFNRYYLEAVLNYDRDFRLSIANQKSISPSQRSFRWDEVSRTLKIQYLDDNQLPKCEYCRGPGHFVSKCKQKMEDDLASPSALGQRIVDALQQPAQQPHYNPPPTPPSQPAPLMPPSYRPPNPGAGRGGNNGGGRRRRRRNPPNPAGGAGGNRHPSQVPCNYYNSNTACQQNPCPFLHVCDNCGQNDHAPGVCTRQPNNTPFHP